MSKFFDEAGIRDMLKPLQQQETASIEYVCQYKAIEEFNRRLRFLELLYADIYNQIANLDRCLKR